MKLQVGRNELLSALSAVIGVVERRQTLPVLSNFLLELKDDELVVTGTDLEIELQARARVQNLAPGRATLPARKLFDICRGLPEGAEISIDAGSEKAQLKSGRSRYSLACLRAEEFPAMGRVDDGRTLTLQRRQLKTLIEKTQFAMAQQDVRYYLNGMLLEVSPQRVRSVATDGHRLALSEIDLETGFDAPSQVIVPRKAVLELQRLLDASEDSVQVKIGAGQIEADLDAVRMTSKLIDGRFPDYERVVPEGGDKRLEADRETVRRALVRTAILSNEKFRGVRLSLDGDKLTLQTHNPEHEEAEEELEVGFEGSAIEIGFNVNYLLDALGALDDERFVMELKNADSSGLIHGAGDGSSKYVVMPMRL
ncbi:MAG: DNA polymerase III subunit beta [Sinimarinibacterium flocculans]|uniref:Beta sliding clamp n=1 Tax=Sinimarinibacterium flocculans TaxID=985250 RepID=A0A318E200_9GAMM|nr:DNA polymerase III subunit beta [Sinimarinibacterium flocculans]MEC9364659.1 DNA polymerase III subunit beta [Pseudomonadota bacterium]PXV64940.1 DNA polymerase III beta subunit [Sinimarinibacterium flocculans]